MRSPRNEHERGPNPRRWAAFILATLVAGGGVMLALFHGDGKVTDGAVDYHSLGALTSIVGGNVLVILLGRQHRLIGVARKPGRAMVVLGVFGLVSLVAFLALAGSGANVLIGLVERCAVYPVLIGLICAGVSIWNRRTLDTLEASSINTGDGSAPEPAIVAE